MKRKLTSPEQKAVRLLHKLAEIWPKTIELFTDNGTLIIIDAETHLVLSDEYFSIPCDGGDPDHNEDKDGNIYINREPPP